MHFVAAVDGEIYALRQTAREQFDPTLPGIEGHSAHSSTLEEVECHSHAANDAEDDDMLQHLWGGLFSTLPYEGRVNVRWRDVGFQVRRP